MTPPAGPGVPTPVRVGDVVYEIPASARAGMRVPARVLADEVIIEAIASDRSLE